MAKTKEIHKTNAMRLVQAANLPHTLHSYPVTDDAVDGQTVAGKLGMPPEKVFKTLVTVSDTKQHYVFVLPVAAELDRKAAAKAVGEKSIDMIHVRELQKLTGYVRGGCSPIGMKKPFVTVLDQSAATQETIVVSGGRIGCQIELAPKDLLQLIDGKLAPVARQG